MRAGCLQRGGLGAVEGLLFGLQLGSLIPLIPPFYCQLFPSYRRSRTEFRICATVHRSNLRPTDATLLFLSPPSIPTQARPPLPAPLLPFDHGPYPPPPPPPHNVHSNIHFSICSRPNRTVWQRDRFDWRVFCTVRGPPEHDAVHWEMGVGSGEKRKLEAKK